MKMASSPPGTVCCFMCKGMVIYKKGDKTRFNNHMNNEHGVVFEIDFLFATCKLNEEERVKVKDVIENELLVEPDEKNPEFNEENVKQQLRRIIPVSNNIPTKAPIELGSDQINCQFCDKLFSLETNAKRQFFKLHVQDCKISADNDEDVEVIKSVTAVEKSIERASRDFSVDGMAELEQISKKRRLSGNSVASSVASRVSTTITKPSQNLPSKPTARTNSTDATAFRVPSAIAFPTSVPQTPRKSPFLVPSKPQKNSPFLVPTSAASKPSPLPQTPFKTNFNARTMQTPKKTNLKTPMKQKTPTKNISLVGVGMQTPMKTPRKSNKDPIAPPSTVKKPTSGYAPSMYPCDECDRGYSSSSARSQHKKKKHTDSAPAIVKAEKPVEDNSNNFPLIDQGFKNSLLKEIDQGIKSSLLKETPILEQPPVTEKAVPAAPQEPLKIKLFPCDGCGKSYPSKMNLKMHKKRSCKGESSGLIIKTESTTSKVNSNLSVDATLEERINPNDTDINDEEATVDKATKTTDESLQSETDEIQNMLMLDNSDDDEDDEDEDIEIVDFVVDPANREPRAPIGQIKNETQVESSDVSTTKRKNEEKADTDGIGSESIENEINEKKETDLNTKKKETDVNTNKRDLIFEEMLKSKYFMDQPSMFSNCTEGNMLTFQKNISFLPGWKMKKNEVKKKNGERIPATHFLSPEKIVVRSGLGVLEYLRLCGAKPEYLNTLSLKLKVKPKNFENYIGKYMFDL
eukprot:GFUD01023448.1.p1 GENE.GFUD01023448.1~~GFUD01023448.1.p1  ORF type:complete len:761 (+),score=210.60 GFUD01023448.1:49-2283(+)